jgi:protein tyrosine phosphatase (PTP) superfamily phosphohydrolase (DUF442 family)
MFDGHDHRSDHPTIHMTRPRPIRIALAAALLALSVLGAAAADVTDISNFHQVSARLYRGAQPDDDEFAALARIGVTTVLDLRLTWEHSTENEQALVTAAGMRYVNVPMNAFANPGPEKLASVRAVLDTGGVVYVHCREGKDRTGAMVALYRIEREGWTNDRAFAEAQDHGIHWYARGLKGLIQTYQPPAALASSAKPDSSGVVLIVVPDSNRVLTPALPDSQ